MRLTNKLKKSLNIYFNKYKNIPNKGKKIGLFITMFLVLFYYYYFITDLNMDEVWNYGFSYNIAHGLIPYKDFNMVVLPFYQLMMALFFKIFGISLFNYHFFNALIITIIFYFLHKRIGIFNTFCLLLYIFLIPIPYGYNTFISILLILILYLEDDDFKYKNLLIGLFTGAILMTKINLGIFIFIPYFIKSKKKINSIIYTMITPIIIFIYLLITNSLLSCIDYCFLGLSNFQDNALSFPSVLIVLVLLILYLIYKLSKTKDLNYLYLILYLVGICYPICDVSHFASGLLPVVFYIFLTSKNYYLKLGLRTFVIFFLVITTIPNIIVNNGIYLSNHDTFIKYRRFNSIGDYNLKKIEDYILENDDKRVFVFSYLAYTIKIDLGKTLDKFDLINKGNMGSDEIGYLKELDDICSSEECLFILYPEEFDEKYSQVNPIVRDYVLENYEVCDQITPIDFSYCQKK